jgi:sigma-E factor negative regulatory protein RseB
VTTYIDGVPSLSTAYLEHVPGQGTAVRVVPSTDVPVAADVFDADLLSLLDTNFHLAVTRVEPCRGRPAHLIQVTRPGQHGGAAVAARFWVDTATGLVLRRDVLDGDGRVLRSNELVDLAFARPSATLQAGRQLTPSGRHLDEVGLADLTSQGWQVPQWLPGGLTLYDARVMERSGGPVVQLAYSDGLSTLSLFQQRGVVRTTSGGLVRRVGKGTVWQSFDTPLRVVWSTRGRTWTVVSDAPAQVVDEAVRALPHEAPTSSQDGIGPRVWRGMSRVGEWLNPFS